VIPESSLIEAIMSISGRVDFLYQFFVTVQIAIFALLFIYDEAVESMSFVARCMAVVGVALFDFMNGLGIVKAYVLLDATHDQYRHLYGKADRFVPEFFERFVQASYADAPIWVYATHGLAFVIVMLAILSRNFIRSRKPAKLETPA